MQQERNLADTLSNLRSRRRRSEVLDFVAGGFRGMAHGYDPWSSHSVRIWRLDQWQFREQSQGSIGGNLRSMGGYSRRYLGQSSCILEACFR